MAATSRRFMEGPLSKWTNVMNGWQYRWFVLDQSAGLLSYYTVGRFTGRALNGILFLQSDLCAICTVFLWCLLLPVGKWHRNSCSFPLPTFVATNKADSYHVMLMHTCKEWSLWYASQSQPAATLAAWPCIVWQSWVNLSPSDELLWWFLAAGIPLGPMRLQL